MPQGGATQRTRTLPKHIRPSKKTGRAEQGRAKPGQGSIGRARPRSARADQGTPRRAYLRAAAARSRHRQLDRLRDGGGLLRVTDERPSAGGRLSAAIVAAAAAAASRDYN